MLKNDAIVKDTRRENDLDAYEYKIGIWSGRDVRGKTSERTTWKMVMPKTTEIHTEARSPLFNGIIKDPRPINPRMKRGRMMFWT